MRWALILLVLLACVDDPPSSSLPDPDVSECCWDLVYGAGAVDACLYDLTAPGECRWLTCLGGALYYEVCR